MTRKNTALKEHILRQRDMLYNMLLDPMHRAARRCARVWEEKPQLDLALVKSLRQVPYCSYLYAMDLNGIQVSANASQDGLIESDFRRNRSRRPYMQETDPDKEMILSGAYISLRANRPSLTAVQKVHVQGVHTGYLGADFDLRDLPITKELYTEPGRWRQIKGDPAIRAQVFEQSRIQSSLDDQLDLVLPVLEELVTEHGAFQVEIHFSSSRATLWFMRDPYRYQLADIDELTDPDICLAYPHHPYPGEAQIPQQSIRPILQTFRHLRFADDTIYLRAGSINLFNGMVGLNFSCDGSHYIPHEQFLARDSEFWNGI
ncbi:PDC sensor domain-containing protein [Thiolapillus sp.]